MDKFWLVVGGGGWGWVVGVDIFWMVVGVVEGGGWWHSLV